MQEQPRIQQIFVNVYRTTDRVVVAAPMPGMEPENIVVHVTEDGRLILEGESRALLKNVKEQLLYEWTVGAYHRELALPNAVDGEQATVTYRNGVLVVALPISKTTRAAKLTLGTVGPAHGERRGKAGH
jgi:HSP20 family protein